MAANPELMVVTPWAHRADEVIAALGTDGVHGLTDDDALARRSRFGPNELNPHPPVARWRRFVQQFASALVILLIVAAAISGLAWAIEGSGGVPIESLVIIAIVIVNALLGYLQEARADRAVAALRAMTATTARVVRSGHEQRIDTIDLVIGDVVILGEGDAVAADARVIESASLAVAEAALTGESIPVEKHREPVAADSLVGDRANMVLAGTAVTRGRARVVVTATAMATEMGSIADLLARTTDDATPLQREVTRIGRVLGGAVIAITIALIALLVVRGAADNGHDLVDIFLVAVSLAVAAVPEGLPAVLSVVLAIGVQRMAARRALVKRLASVETLGSATVVCCDKTGTLTSNEMTVRSVVLADRVIKVTGSGLARRGDFIVDGVALDRRSDPRSADTAVIGDLTALLRAARVANDAQLSADGDNWFGDGDPTEVALLVAVAKFDPDGHAGRRLAEVPFSSERKFMSTINTGRTDTGTIDGDDLVLFAKGAPDVLIGRCSHVLDNGRTIALDDTGREHLLAQVDQLAAQALRPLAMARRSVDHRALDDPEAAETDLTYLGLVGMIDPPRPEALDAVRAAHSAGVGVVMITGDHPLTADRIATDLGIKRVGDDLLTGATIEQLDDAQLRTAVRTTTVYARVSPEHKLRIVEALRADGQIVAMTGDGVNDAPALRAADIGIAMGRTGTEVSREAADMILADDNFATIIAAIGQGRVIFANIGKFLRFLLSSNLGEILTMVGGVVLAGSIGLSASSDGLAVPLLATQILWINLLTDAAPALALGVEPPEDDVMARPPRAPGERILGTTMWRRSLTTALVMAVVTLLAFDLGSVGGIFAAEGDIDTGRTFAFTTLVLAQLFNALNTRSDHHSALHAPFANRLLWGAIAMSVLLQIAVVEIHPLQQAFGTTDLGFTGWMTALVLASAVLWVEEFAKIVRRRRR